MCIPTLAQKLILLGTLLHQSIECRLEALRQQLQPVPHQCTDLGPVLQKKEGRRRPHRLLPPNGIAGLRAYVCMQSDTHLHMHARRGMGWIPVIGESECELGEAGVGKGNEQLFRQARAIEVQPLQHG